MREKADATHPALGAAVVPLLAVMVFLGYVDRGNLATAGPLVQGELHLSSTALGTLLSSFYWSYVPGQILVASLAERLTPQRVLALSVALWGLATTASGLVGGFIGLLVLRLVLGLAESAAFPCSSKIIAQHLPGEKMGVANGQINLGVALGPAFGTFVGGHVMAHLGWRATFLGFGVASLVWLLPWRATTGRGRAEIGTSALPHARADAPSYAAILRRRDLWGTCLGHFGYCYALYFVIYWLPVYLVKARGFTLGQMATIGGLVYVVNAVTTMITGFACDRRMRAGSSANLVRKAAMTASGALMAATLVSVAFGSAGVAVAGLFCAALGLGVAGPNVFSIPQTIAGPHAAGKWVGVMNAVGNLSGIVAPIVTGYLVDRTGQFFWAFVVAAGAALTGVIGWTVVVRRVAPLKWPAKP